MPAPEAILRSRRAESDAGTPHNNQSRNKWYALTSDQACPPCKSAGENNGSCAKTPSGPSALWARSTGCDAVITVTSSSFTAAFDTCVLPEGVGLAIESFEPEATRTAPKPQAGQSCNFNLLILNRGPVRTWPLPAWVYVILRAIERNNTIVFRRNT